MTSSAARVKLVDPQGREGSRKRPEWTHYYDHPQELFAEGFAVWVKGGEALKRLTFGNAQVAKTTEDHFERQFG